MPVTDEISASTQIYCAAVRARAKEPLTVAKFVDLQRCFQDVYGGHVWNAHALIAEVKEKYPKLFEEPVVMKRPEPPREDSNKNAFDMSRQEFEAAFAKRFPWVE